MQLIGLRLAVIRRAADMCMIHFGTMRPAPKPELPFFEDKPRGFVGDFGLHIQCPWRIETDECIVTGRSDLWQPLDRPKGFEFDDWDYETQGNLQDHRIEQFMSSSDNLVVESVDCQVNGTFILGMSGGFRLVVFPSGSTGEAWRFFRPNSGESHLVVSGGAIERDDS